MFPPLHPGFRTLAVAILMAWLAGFVILVLLHYVYFVVLPRRAIEHYKRTDPERLRRYLEWVVATPSLLGEAQKLVARGGLVAIYLTQGRHAEAAAHCRAELASLAKAWHVLDTPALEADIRRRLADCLEALGQKSEAEDERRRAEECVDRAPEDPLRYLTLGTLLEREHRYAEACTAFEQALSLTPETNHPVRIECMIHLVLACFNAGRPAECLHWAEEAIVLGAQGRHLRCAHRMAGVACGNLGRLDEAEDHIRRAYDVADAGGDRGVMGEILVSLADIQRRRGKLVEANAAAIKAGSGDPKAVRMSLAVQCYVLKEWGRFEEALEMLRRHGEVTTYAIPAHERRLRAVCALDRSRIETECGRTDDAWVHVQQAVSELGNDAKLGLNCEAALAWILAASGQADESRRIAAEVEARLLDFAHDPSTCRAVLYDLGMAACTLGDHEQGEDYWSRYLDLSPDPVYCPTALYFRGECLRHLGDSTDAEADFREAIAMDIDTHHTRLARSRLRELSLS
jgi:tetratricopeptide (TPR) repeat protein